MPSVNHLTTGTTGRTVLVGTAQAIALGNATVQLLATDSVTALKQVHTIIDRSYPARIFEPVGTGRWNRHAKRFGHYCEGSYA
jgi:hypothetical protein